MTTTNVATTYEITEVIRHGGFHSKRTGRFARARELQDFLKQCPYPIYNMERAAGEFASAYGAAPKDHRGIAAEFEFSHGWATYTVRPVEGGGER